MKQDSRTGRYMTTGRSTAGKASAGGAFDRVQSRGGEIIVTNTNLITHDTHQELS
jgi:hypothetical protein